MADYTKKIRRQLERQKRREFYRQMRENQLLDRAYRGLSEEQRALNAQLQIQLEWLNRQL